MFGTAMMFAPVSEYILNTAKYYLDDCGVRELVIGWYPLELESWF